MSDKFDKMIKEIATKNNNGESSTNPVLVLQSMNERLIRDNKLAQKNLLENFKTELEELSNRWGEEAKNQAEQTIQAAINSSKETMNQSIEENVKKTSAAVREEIEKIINQQVQESLKQTRYLSLINLAAAGMSISSVLVLLFAYA